MNKADAIALAKELEIYQKTPIRAEAGMDAANARASKKNRIIDAVNQMNDASLCTFNQNTKEGTIEITVYDYGNTEGGQENAKKREGQRLFNDESAKSIVSCDNVTCLSPEDILHYQDAAFPFMQKYIHRKAALCFSPYIDGIGPRHTAEIEGVRRSNALIMDIYLQGGAPYVIEILKTHREPTFRKMNPEIAGRYYQENLYIMSHDADMLRFLAKEGLESIQIIPATKETPMSEIAFYEDYAEIITRNLMETSSVLVHIKAAKRMLDDIITIYANTGNISFMRAMDTIIWHCPERGPVFDLFDKKAHEELECKKQAAEILERRAMILSKTTEEELAAWRKLNMLRSEIEEYEAPWADAFQSFI